MNVKELIGKYEYLNHDCFRRVDTSEVLKDLKQLDEPEKVKVPQFVAEIIEFAKKHDWNLRDVFLDVGCDDPFGSDVFNWLYQKRNNIDVFARAWLDGYEVEKEPKYLVKVKGLGHEFRVLKYNIFYNDWFTGSDREDSSLRVHHTRKEIEDASFGWVFDCEGIEVQEVTE